MKATVAKIGLVFSHDQKCCPIQQAWINEAEHIVGSVGITAQVIYLLPYTISARNWKINNLNKIFAKIISRWI